MDVLDINYSPAPFLRLTVDQYATMAPTHIDSLDGFVWPHSCAWVFATDEAFKQEARRLSITATDTRLTLGFHANENDFMAGKYYWQVRSIEGVDSVILLEGIMNVNFASRRV